MISTNNNNNNQQQQTAIDIFACLSFSLTFFWTIIHTANFYAPVVREWTLFNMDKTNKMCTFSAYVAFNKTTDWQTDVKHDKAEQKETVIFPPQYCSCQMLYECIKRSEFISWIDRLIDR